jgi:co-chaperonin GroES (HSP10)
MSKLRALYDQIIVRPEQMGERKLESGLVLPATTTSVEVIGKVIALGDGIPRPDGSMMRPRLEVGDKVLFLSNGAIRFKLQGEQLVKLSPQQVLAVIAPDS